MPGEVNRFNSSDRVIYFINGFFCETQKKTGEKNEKKVVSDHWLSDFRRSVKTGKERPLEQCLSGRQETLRQNLSVSLQGAVCDYPVHLHRDGDGQALVLSGSGQ